MQRWLNDNELCDMLGDWWVNDLDVEREEREWMLRIANEALEARGLALRVVDVRDADSGDNLDWLVQE